MILFSCSILSCQLSEIYNRMMMIFFEYSSVTYPNPVPLRLYLMRIPHSNIVRITACMNPQPFFEAADIISLMQNPALLYSTNH